MQIWFPTCRRQVQAIFHYAILLASRSPTNSRATRRPACELVARAGQRNGIWLAIRTRHAHAGLRPACDQLANYSRTSSRAGRKLDSVMEFGRELVCDPASEKDSVMKFTGFKYQVVTTAEWASSTKSSRRARTGSTSWAVVARPRPHAADKTSGVSRRFFTRHRRTAAETTIYGRSVPAGQRPTRPAPPPQHRVLTLLAGNSLRLACAQRAVLFVLCAATQRQLPRPG